MSGAERLLCDAAHLIPHSKGDAVRNSSILILVRSSSTWSVSLASGVIRRKI
jgi:hypothetical protein